MAFEDAKSYRNKIEELQSMRDKVAREFGDITEKLENSNRQLNQSQEDKKKIDNKIIETKKELEDINKSIEEKRKIEVQTIIDIQNKKQELKIIEEYYEKRIK